MLELFRRYLRPYRWRAVTGVLTKMVEVIFEVLTPLVVARMIDVGVANRDTGLIVRLGLLLLGFTVVSYLFTLVCQYQASIVSQDMGTDIRNALYRRINQFSAPELDRFGTPSLVTRVTNDVVLLQVTVALLIRTSTRWPLLAIGSVVAALAIDLRLGLVFVVCMPLIGGVFAVVMARSLPFYRSMQSKLDHLALVAREGLSGARVIRAFRREDHEDARFAQAADDQSGVAISVGRLSSLLSPATLVIMDLGVVAILWVGGWRVEVGGLSQGEVLAFVNYMTNALTAVTYLATLTVTVMRGAASSRRILEVLDCEPAVRDGSDADVELDARAPALELERVSFSYAGATAPALDGVSLSAAAGTTLGVIGGTGSGKSTLANLLPRLYDATGGTVRLFGVPVRDMSLNQVRALVSIVPQRASLVSGTIRSNLLWRRPTAIDEELWEALSAAQAAEFVRGLADGLDAIVEADGRNFSGGQRQRLTIARALVGSPRVLVLDDSASALDFKTDASLRQALGTLDCHPTTVMISQRVSSVMGADQILVLDHGRPAGLGTHEELLRGCQIYREICLSQLKNEEVTR